MIVTIGICSCNCSRAWYCSAEVACLPFFSSNLPNGLQKNSEKLYVQVGIVFLQEMSYFRTHRFPSLLSIWVLLRRMDSVILGINRRRAMALGSLTQRNTKYLRLQQLCEAQISQCSD